MTLDHSPFILWVSLASIHHMGPYFPSKINMISTIPKKNQTNNLFSISTNSSFFLGIESPFSFICLLWKEKKIKAKLWKLLKPQPLHIHQLVPRLRSAIVHDLGACKSRWVAWRMCTLRRGGRGDQPQDGKARKGWSYGWDGWFHVMWWCS